MRKIKLTQGKFALVNTAKEAAMAYNNYVLKFDGEFARLNEV